MARTRGIALMVVRANPGSRTGHHTEWLSGLADTISDAREEAQSLADDPRDTIERVNLWSVGRDQFVGVVRRSL